MNETIKTSRIFYLFGFCFIGRKLFYVKSDRKGFDELRFYKGRWITDWPEGMEFYYTGKSGEDCIPGGLHWELISERVKQVFIVNNIRGIQFLKVNAFHIKTGLSLGQYYAIHVMVNVEKSNLYLLDKMDIFRWYKTSIYVSERLKRLLEDEHVTSGMSFEGMNLP